MRSHSAMISSIGAISGSGMSGSLVGGGDEAVVRVGRARGAGGQPQEKSQGEATHMYSFRANEGHDISWLMDRGA
jgi:hypothetical protein